MDPMFAPLPEDLSSLTDDDLSAHEAAHVEAVTKIKAQDADFTGDREAEQILAELREGVAALKAIRAEQSSREEARANFDADVDSLAGEVLPAVVEEAEVVDEEAEAKEEKVEGELAAETETLADATEENDEPEAAAENAEEPEAVAEEPVAVVAAAERRVMRSRQASRRHDPVVVRDRVEEKGAPLLATMEFGGIRGNSPLASKDKLVEFLDDAIIRTEGVTARTVLASARATFPDDRRLTADFGSNAQKLSVLRSQIRSLDMDAIVASGGRCVPLTPRYDLPFIATSRTPVWDSLATTGADRGGITYPQPLGISDVTDGITVVTEAEDAAGGGSATKSCVVVACDSFLEAETVAIAGCVTHGNFGARSWPERVDTISDLLNVAHAQALETMLLTAIRAYAAAGTNDLLVDEAKYGAVSTLLQGIIKAAAQYRNRHRMEPDATLNLLIPAWTVDLMVADVNHAEFNRFVARAQMEAVLRGAGVNPTFYLDSASTGTSMVYGANGATNLDEFKTLVAWALYAPDTFIGLDGGRLDLGLVRDSVLNETNDFQLFFETWNGIAMPGIEVVWVESTVCPSGATAPKGTLITC